MECIYIFSSKKKKLNSLFWNNINSVVEIPMFLASSQSSFTNIILFIWMAQSITNHYYIFFLVHQLNYKFTRAACLHLESLTVKFSSSLGPNIVLAGSLCNKHLNKKSQEHAVSLSSWFLTILLLMVL